MRLRGRLKLRRVLDGQEGEREGHYGRNGVEEV